MVSSWPTCSRSAFCRPLAFATLAGVTPYISATNFTVSPGCTRYAVNGPVPGDVADRTAALPLAEAVAALPAAAVPGVGAAAAPGADAPIAAVGAEVATGG